VLAVLEVRLVLKVQMAQIPYSTQLHQLAVEAVDIVSMELKRLEMVVLVVVLDT
jgi:hypothetical protein